jgi:HPt (histidine-containing phosphotransfer) domain-containing protein
MEQPQLLADRTVDDLLRVGGLEFIRELFGGLDDLAPDLIERATGCAASGDIAGVRAHVHNLKGAAANLGAERLAAASERILKAVAEGAIPADALQELQTCWTELRALLRAREYIADA